MEELIAVKNGTRRPVTLQLAYEGAPKTDLDMHTVDHDPKTGVIAKRRVKLRLPLSVTIGPGEVRTSLPAQMAAAARARGLTVAPMGAPPPTPPSPSAQKTKKGK